MFQRRRRDSSDPHTGTRASDQATSSADTVPLGLPTGLPSDTSHPPINLSVAFTKYDHGGRESFTLSSHRSQISIFTREQYNARYYTGRGELLSNPEHSCGHLYRSRSLRIGVPRFVRVTPDYFILMTPADCLDGNHFL